MDQQTLRRFILLAQITFVFIFLVIIAGSVVRATGSGMGCPDWPKCFGKWVPPTDVSELPANYKELYAGEHNAVAEFNALNTWTEYLNRLVGAILGVLIFIQFILSIKFRRADIKLFGLSLIELILIGFQGWLGAKVVSSNLAPVKITIHMVVALVILSIAVAIIYRAKKLVGDASEQTLSPVIRKLAIAALFFTIVQIMLGTQIREEVDLLLKNFDANLRDQIIDNLSPVFEAHRSFSILIMALNFWLTWKLIQSEASHTLKKYGKLLAGVLVLELAAGIILNRFDLPPVVQPIHLLLACIAYSLQFLIILRLMKSST